MIFKQWPISGQHCSKEVQQFYGQSSKREVQKSGFMSVSRREAHLDG